MTVDSQTPITGSHGSYQWLATGQYGLRDFLERCPMALVGKHVAVTSLDSGPLSLSEEEKAAGWQSRLEVAYSPRIESPTQLPRGGFDEWYIFDSPRNLGQLWRGDIFEMPPTTKHVAAFVNFGDFAPHSPDLESLLRLFWEQLERIQPESYVADGNAFLTFATREKQIFDAACKAMGVERA